jgi:transcriptional regulator with XRE-family HTH domain
MPVKPYSIPSDIRKLRKALGLNQESFWTRLRSTQSCGSRYENDNRTIPAQTRELIRLTYIEKIDTTLLVGDLASRVRAIIDGEDIDQRLIEKQQELQQLQKKIDSINSLLVAV